MELTTRFPQRFATIAWKASFIFLSSDIQLIQKKHMDFLGPIGLIISGWEYQRFSAVGFGEGLSDIRSGLFMDMVQLITWAQSTSWLCDWEHPFTAWPEGENLGTLHDGQTLPWRTIPTWCGIMRFLCTPATQLVDQPCTILISTINFEIHH